MSSVNTGENDIDMESCESTSYKTVEEYNAAVIYHNDNIMEKIVSYIPKFIDRVKLRLVSKRFREVVGNAGYVTPTIIHEEDFEEFSHDELCIGYLENSMMTSIRFGSFAKDRRINILSRYSNIEDRPREQPEQIMNALENMLFARESVKTVSIGKRKLYQEMEWQSVPILLEFVVTKDILMYMENFPNLHTVKFFDAVFNQESEDYITSDECQFKNLIETCSMKWTDREPWMAAMINKKLKHLEITNLEDIKELCEQAVKLELMLDTLHIQMLECENVEEALNSMSTLAEHTRKIQIELIGSVVPVFGQYVNRWMNVTSLILQPKKFYLRRPANRVENGLTKMFDSIATLPFLEKLKLSDEDFWEKWVELGKAVQHMTNLKELHLDIRRIWNTTPLKELFKLLPLSIETMTMSWLRIHEWDEELVELFTSRFSKSLKNLSIGRRKSGTNPEGANEKIFQTIVRNMNLTKLVYCHEIDREDVFQCVLDDQQLDELDVYISRDIMFSSNCELVMKDHFENYEKKNKMHMFPDEIDDCIFYVHPPFRAYNIIVSKRRRGTLKLVE